MKRETLAVTASGVGRPDYSENIEYSIEQQIRSLQERFFYSVRYTGLAGVIYPNVYEAPLSFLVNGALQFAAPTQKPWVFYLVQSSSGRNALVVIALNRYNNYTEYLNGNIAERLGTTFGYGIATLAFTKGIPTVPGSVYSVQYAEFCGLQFNMDVTIHGLIGGPEEI